MRREWAGEVFYDRCIKTLSDLDLTTELVRSVAGKTARKYPDISLHITIGSTSKIIRDLECGRLNLGFIRPVENIGSLCFFSIAHERYLLAVARDNPLADRQEVSIEDLRDQKIIAFARNNLSYTERYFSELFEEHDLNGNIAYSCDDTFSVISLVSAGFGVGFAPEWVLDLPNRSFELKKVRGIDHRIGLGVAWSKEDPTAARDDIIDIARTLGRVGRDKRLMRVGASA